MPFFEDGTALSDRAVAHTSDEDFSTVRVLLNYECENTVDPIYVTMITLHLYGAYYIDQNLKPIVGTITQPAVVRITAISGRVNVMHGGGIVYQGESVDINRVLVGVEGGYATVETTPETESSGTDCLGNFRITANGSHLRIVNHVPTAHYLYGVVTHEMGDNRGLLEALKCQAIVSKSYAFS